MLNVRSLDKICLFFILVFALLLRIFFIDFVPCSYDEMMHIIIAKAKNLESTLVAFETTVHPPIFFLLLKSFNFVTQVEEYRLVSILSWCIYVIYYIKIIKYYKFSKLTYYTGIYFVSFGTGLLIISLSVRSYMLANAILTAGFLYFIKFMTGKQYRHIIICLSLFLLALSMSYIALLYLITALVILVYNYFRKLKLSYSLIFSSIVFVTAIFVIYFSYDLTSHIEENVYNIFYLKQGLLLNIEIFQYLQNIWLNFLSIYGPIKQYPLYSLILILFCSILLISEFVKFSKLKINLKPIFLIIANSQFRVLLSFFIIIFFLNLLFSILNIYPLFQTFRHQSYLFTPFSFIILYLVDKISFKKAMLFLVIVIMTSWINIYNSYNTEHKYITKIEFGLGEEIKEYREERLSKDMYYFIDFTSLIRILYQVDNILDLDMYISKEQFVDDLIKFTFKNRGKESIHILYVDLWYDMRSIKKLFRHPKFNAGDSFVLMTYQPFLSKMDKYTIRAGGKNLYRVKTIDRPYKSTNYIEMVANRITKN